MTRWLITGAGGQLGSDLCATLVGEDVHALVRTELDIVDPAAVAATIEALRPDVVINAAAYTAVDAAESDEDAAYRVNATGPAALATALATYGGRLVHVSTDYVFAGEANEPYETDADPDPRSAYGRTKLAGERSVRERLPDASYVVRTAWAYGRWGANFVKTMARLEKSRDTVSVVDDQRGSPTWSADLASGLVALACSHAPAGVYHCTNGGDTTWFGFARAVFEELGADPARVLATTSDAVHRPARRPAYSVLSDRAWRDAGLAPMRPWRDALKSAFVSGRDAFIG